MAFVRAVLHLADRGPADALTQRSIAQGLNVDSRRISTPVAYPYVVVVSGEIEGFDLADLWEDLADVVVVERTET